MPIKYFIILEKRRKTEQLNKSDHQRWNYRLKGLGQYLVNKSRITDDDIDRSYISKRLRDLNKTIDNLYKF